MKVLFLDVDGVLNSADWFRKMDPNERNIAAELDPKAVARVKRVIDKTGAVIVLSSSWRHHGQCVQAIEAAGLAIHDKTPEIRDHPRAAEIACWLMKHPDVTDFAIIDDDSDASKGDEGLAECFVRTHWKHGMYGKHEKALVELLGVRDGGGAR